MSDPLITSDDLAIYLRDSAIDTDRAQMMIDDAQAACEMIVNPVPVGAAWIVRKVAGRGYVTATTSKAAAGSPMGALPGGLGGIFLLRAEERALRTFAGGGGAFSISTLAPDYAPILPWWDTGVVFSDGTSMSDWDIGP